MQVCENRTQSYLFLIATTITHHNYRRKIKSNHEKELKELLEKSVKIIKSPVLEKKVANRTITHAILFIYLYLFKQRKKSFNEKFNEPVWLCLSYVKLPQVSKLNEFKSVRPSSYDLFYYYYYFFIEKISAKKN